jgi:hypothetical protein
MSGLADKAKSAVGGGGSDDKSAQGGNSVERSADKTANDHTNLLASFHSDFKTAD